MNSTWRKDASALPAPSYQRVKDQPAPTTSTVHEVVHERSTPLTGEMLEVDDFFSDYKNELVVLLNKYRNNISLPGEAPGRSTWKNKGVKTHH